MLDLFRPVPLEARRENLAAYAKFLVERDGTMDLERRQLSLRETGMARHERVVGRVRDIDHDLFARQYASFDKRTPTSPETLLLLALAKVNAAEAFGVNTVYETVLKRAIENDDRCELTLLVEETYHTRILVSTALSYGVEIKSAYRPPTALRGLIGVLGFTPQVIARPLTLAAEVLGVLLFSNLLAKARVILEGDPELRDSVEERLCEIITDELGHISFNRAHLGAAGMKQARMLVPLLAAAMAGVIPEVEALGAVVTGRHEDVHALSSGRLFPEHVVRAAFIS